MLVTAAGVGSAVRMGIMGGRGTLAGADSSVVAGADSSVVARTTGGSILHLKNTPNNSNTIYVSYNFFGLTRDSKI